MDITAEFGTAYMYFFNIIKSLTLWSRKINVVLFSEGRISCAFLNLFTKFRYCTNY
jgi:hypothetical protein